MKIFPVLLCLLFFASACQEKVEPPTRNFNLEFQQYFTEQIKSLLREQQDSLLWLKRLYEERDFTPIWTADSLRLDTTAYAFISELKNAQAYGLEPYYYDVKTLHDRERVLKGGTEKQKFQALSFLEILLSKNYMKFGKHLHVGILEGVDSIAEIPRKAFRIDMPSYLNRAARVDSIIPNLLALQPNHIQYRNLQKAMANYLKRASFSTDQVSVVNFREDSLKAVKLAKDALVLHQYLTENDKDSLYLKALANFQKDHGLQADQLIGTNTAKALSLSPYEYYQRLKVSLERWRWKKEWKGQYVYANIPSYQLEVYEDDQLLARHKTVVGSRSNQTPEIVDTLEYIIAYPYWNVPKRISVEEILVKAQNDSSYLDRNQYQVILDGTSIDPNSVAWNEVTPDSFNYRIRQNGGGINALGYVKFIFPNKDAIYFHDTPTKSHFSKEIRAYSHGCIRVQNALELADFFLEKDENKYTKDSVRTFIKRRKEKWMHLNRELPVYLYYIPTTADDNGNIVFYQDVYNRDRLWMQLMAQVEKG